LAAVSILRVLTAAALALALPGQRPVAAEDPDPARDFFAKGGTVCLAITLEPADRQQLRDRPRDYVPATFRVDGDRQPWTGAGIKLKGAAGSFQKIDEKPGFTVHLGKFGGEQRLHGLRRFHLNNGVQDSSRLCEWVGHEVFTAAGLPAPRVAHAWVELDGEPLGIYVLRESYDKQFLLRAFGHDHGNLYDGGFCCDVDHDLEKDAGDGADDRADLHRLREAGEQFDPEQPTRLEQLLDVNALIDFVAVEAMLCHWDGYSQNRNNFRLWLGSEPGSGRFLPHGMDQLFGDTDASILHRPGALVANALMRHPGWRQRYRERLVALLPLFAPKKLEAGIAKAQKQIERAFGKIGPDEVREQAAAAEHLIGRVRDRYKNLREQVRAPEPKPLQFPGGRAVALKAWRAAAKSDHLELRETDYRGVRALQITGGAPAGESVDGVYRTTVLLARGRYRLSAVLRCEDVTAANEAPGALLAVGDATSEVLVGQHNWRELTCEFDVNGGEEDVELELALRAQHGRVWFRTGAMKLERIE
jgi:hypothetical protein